MQSYNPTILGCSFDSQDYWMVAKHVNKKNAGKPRVRSLAALAATFRFVTFNNYVKPPGAKVNFARIWCISTNPTPTSLGYLTLKRLYGKFDLSWEGYLVWQTGLPTLKGHPTYHVNVIKLKWEIIWTGGLPHLSWLPCLPGVPLLHVNRP